MNTPTPGSSAELMRLRDELERRQAHLVEQIQAATHARAEAQLALFADGRAAEDSGEASADRAQFELLAPEERGLRADLTEVEHALKKFTRGTYGPCEYCGRPIPLDRLKVVPEARFEVQL